ncbi:hypothetical protein X275_07720 [Marinitoga sp. 1197]|uniref:hypothetical protein n=1 Tax=Marinitoga sp. 1197 TaxID=1428449 RepID=UPI000640CD65|nr:hypothetical protein [Marinitoga sp. 1197]KLO21830.1 hypothetical protein X275_07720 [Marinitoga sp. 1197]
MKKLSFIIFLVVVFLFVGCMRVDKSINKSEKVDENDIILKDVVSEYYPETGKVLITWKGDENTIYQIYSKKESDKDYIFKGEVKGLKFEDTNPFAGNVQYKVMPKETTKSIPVKSENSENVSMISLNDFISINNGIVKNFDHRIKDNKIYINDEKELENLNIDPFSLLALGLSENIYNNEYIYLSNNNFSIMSSEINILKIDKFGKINVIGKLGNLPYLIIFIRNVDEKLIVGGIQFENMTPYASLYIYDLKNPEQPIKIKNYNLMLGAQSANFGKSGENYYVIYFGGNNDDGGIYVQFLDSNFDIIENKKVKISNSPYIMNFAKYNNKYIINDGSKTYYFEITDSFSENDIISVDFTASNNNFTRFYSFDGKNLYTVDDKKIKIYSFENNKLSQYKTININYDETSSETPSFLIVNKIDNYLNISILYLNSSNSNPELSKYYYYIYDIENEKIIYSDFDDSENAMENYRNINPIIFKYH